MQTHQNNGHGTMVFTDAAIHPHNDASFFLDSSIDVSMIKGEDQPTHDVCHCIVQIQDMCNTFSSINFSYVPRTRNKSDDLLAKQALVHSQSILWLYLISHND